VTTRRVRRIAEQLSRYRKQVTSLQTRSRIPSEIGERLLTLMHGAAAQLTGLATSR
jgi:hypothetical protein